MHKNLQFCDICGHVVVEKLLFTSTYWECKNCEGKKEAAKFIQETFATETIIARPSVLDEVHLHEFGGSKLSKREFVPNLLWRSLNIPQYRKPVVESIRSSVGKGAIVRSVDIYEPTGRVRDNGEQFEYEYQWLRRESF